MTNNNVLEGMTCPQCGNEEPFIIEMTGAFKVFDNGTEDMYDTNWDDDSECVCGDCDFAGHVFDFRNGHLVRVEFTGSVLVKVNAEPDDGVAWVDALGAAIAGLTPDQKAASLTATGHEIVLVHPSVTAESST